MVYFPFRRLFAASQASAIPSTARRKSGAIFKKRPAHRWFFEQLEVRIVPSTLTTDKAVYAPTETAVLQLSGFQSGETVALQVVRTDGNTGSRQTSPQWLAVDGGAGDFDGTANGQLTVHYTVPDDVSLDSFQITATGKSSGSIAQVTIWGDSSHLLESDGDASSPPATTTALSSSDLSATPGEPVRFTATVTSANTVTSGTVQFLVDGFNLGDPVPVVNGTAISDVVSTLSAGSHTVTASYSDAGGSFDSSSTDLEQMLTDNQNLGAASTDIVISASTEKELDDDAPVPTFTATVSSTTVVDRGTVQFSVDNEPLGAPVSVVNGQAASGQVPDLGPGEHLITADYSDGSGTFQSNSGTFIYTVAWADVRPKDLAPGEVATILAGGFQVGETVDVQIKNLTNGHVYGPFSVVDGGAADLDGVADGNIQTSWTVPADALASKLQVTVTGESSGLSADAAFADALNTTTALSSSLNPAGTGKSVTLTAAVSAPTAASVSVNFNGINSNNSNGTGSTCNCQPPDTIVAAGPVNVIEAVNTAIKISSKSGSQISFQSMASFFAPVFTSGDSLTDPFVLYDENISNGAGNPSGRFIVGMLEFTSSTAVDFLDLAVSNDWDATHGFTEMHKVGVGAEGGTAGNNFADYPRAGFNADALIVDFNMFSLTTGSFVHPQIWVAQLSTLTDANNATFTTFHSAQSSSFFTMVPAVMHNPPSGNPATDPAYLVVRGTTTPSTIVSVIKLTNVLSNTPTLTTTTVTVPSYSNAVPATQPGTGGVFPASGGIDFRILNAAWRNNILVADQTIRLGTTGSVDQSRWYQFDTTSTPALTMSGNIAPGTGISTMYPSIDIDANNDLGMTYMEMSSTEFISMYVTGRQPTDPAGTMAAGTLVAAGNVTYSTTSNRGGDFSGTSIDPSTGTSFWSANEFSNSSISVFWSTQVVNFTIGQAAIVNTGSVTFQDGGTTLAVVPVSSGSAALSTSTLAAGNHTITATYTDGSTFNSSFGTLIQTVNGTNTTVSSSSNPSTYGQSVSFTANATTPLATATAGAGYNGLLSSDSNPTTVNGTGSCNCQPPDTIAAAGPVNVIETVNTAIEWRTKTGTLITREKLGGATGGFFSSLGLAANVTDSFVYYDENISNGAGNPSGRFIVGMLDYSAQTATNFLDIAVSNDWDATHGFTEMHRINVGAEGTSNGFADYPRVGFNADAVFVTFNMFALTTGQPYQHVQVFVMQLASLIDASNGTFVTNHFDEPDPNLFTLAPAAMHSAPADGVMYFVTESDTPAFEINVVKLTNYFTATPTFVNNNVPVASYAEPTAAPQQGGTYSPQIDSRILNAAWRNNILVADHTVFGAGADHARWYQFSTASATPTLTMQGDIAPGAGVYTMYPAIDIDVNNNLGLTYMEMSSSEFVSMYVTGRTPNDPAGTMAPGVRVAAGGTTSTNTRGGDFAGMSVDPSTGTSFWAANEFFNNAVSTSWSTFVSNFSVAAGTSPLTTGQIQFQIDGVNFGAPVTVSGGSAVSAATTAIFAGSHTITANYTDGNTYGDSSGALTQMVNQRPITVTATANSRTYDGTTSAAAIPAITSGSLVNGDTGNFTEVYSTRNVGTNLTLTPSGSVNDGNGGNNYIITFLSANNGTIIARPITVTATANTKTYDANTSAAAVPTITTGSLGLGDTGNFSETYDNASSGTGKTLTPSGSVNDGNAGNNYAITFAPANNGTINPADTSTAVSSSANPSVFGQAVFFSALVTNASGTGPIPTGSVQFVVDGSNLGGPVALDGSGQAVSITTTTLTVGSHTVTVNYANTDGNFNASNGSLAGGQTVVAADTSTVVNTFLNPTVFGQSVTFTATVTANAPSTAVVNTGTVTFLDGVTPLATVSVSATGVATFSTSSLTVGAHTITATFSDGANFNSSSGSTTQTVNPADTSTSVVSSVNPTVFGQSVTFTATVTAVAPSGATVNTGTVQFRIDGVNFGSAVNVNASGVASSAATTTLSAGNHTIAALYSDGTTFNGSNGSLTQTVNAANTSTALVSSSNPSTYGNTVTFTATVTAVAPSTATVNTGTVTFLDGATTLATVTVSATGVAAFVTAALTAGSHTITANYSDGVSFNSSTRSLTQTVNLRPLLISANAANKTEGNTLAFAGSQFTLAGAVNTVALVNGNTVTSVTLTSTGAAAAAEDGSYAIVPSAAVGTGLSNYAITYVPGTLTVLEPPIVATNTPLAAFNEGDASAVVEVATFTHANGIEAAGHFSATVNWGIAGHTADAGVITEDGGGTYHVTATRPVFTEDGGYSAQVTITDNDTAGSIAQNFAGVSLNDEFRLGAGAFIPPDQGSAVGPNHYVELTNDTYAIYNKNGTVAVPPTPLSTFFANAGVAGLGTSISDPRIVYDQASGRWFVAMITTSSNSNSIVLAVSQTSDPTAVWKGVSFTANTTANNFADYPTIAVDANAFYVASNNFLNNASFVGISLTTIPKADLLNPAGPVVSHRTHFENITGGGTAGTTPFTFAPVSAFDSRNHGVILATDGFTPASVIHRYSVNNPGSNASTLTADSPITVASYWNSQNAHQPDGSRTLNNGDFRMGSNNVYQVGNVIWVADSILTSATTGNTAYDAIRWYEIDETTNTVLQSGTISNPSHDYIYPSIAANAAGNVIIGFTATGDATTTDFAGSWYVAGTTTGGVTTFGAPQALRNGSSNYSIVSGGRNRWGDFSAISVDPTNPNAFWIAEETAIPGDPAVTTRTVVWGTQISELVFGNSTAVNNALTVNEPAINGASAVLAAIQTGQASITVEVATFTHANGVEAAGDFTATVDWGIAGHHADPGTVTQDGSGTYHVSATRPVFNAGTYTVSVGISEDNASTTVTDTQVVNQASTSTAVASSENPSTYGDSIAFTATVSAVFPGSGTPTGSVQFVIDGVNFGSPVTLVGGSATSASISTLFVGTHTVTTVYSGDPNFTAGSNGNLSGGQVVKQAPLTITASTNSKTYDGNTSATATPTVAGLKNGDTVTGLAEAYTDKNAGTGKTLIVTAYTVNDGNGGNNYSVTLGNNTTGVINKATLTVTANNASRPEGALNPTFTAGYGGFVGGETLATSGVAGGPSLTTTATASSPVGSYVITAAQGTLAAGNYAFSFVNGTLMVTNVAPTVSITTPTLSDQFFAINTAVSFAGSFIDPGTSLSPAETYTATWTLDTSSQAGTVSGTTVTASHTFTTAGVYDVTLKVTDSNGGSGSANTDTNGVMMRVVIYDPNAGFVTGGGTITTPAGSVGAAWAAANNISTSLTGPSNFGFVSQYK
jgi:hypothetical protein